MSDTAFDALVRDRVFEDFTRPLLALARDLTDLESTFVTCIDWDTVRQLVVVADDSAQMGIGAGGVTPWEDTMCRIAFTSDSPLVSNVAVTHPESVGARELGMQTYLALPIMHDDLVLGTICGASARQVAVDEVAIRRLRLIAQALRVQLSLAMDTAGLHWRVATSEQHVESIKATSDAYRQLALTDELTGLPNRRAFSVEWAATSLRAADGAADVTVCVIDVDKFKTVNDHFGHDTGDKVLQTVGRVLTEWDCPDGFAARLGGDEFIYVMSGCADADVERFVDTVRSEFARQCRELSVPCSLSIGVANSRDTDPALLITTADQGMYLRKSERRAPD